ncbi:MAG: sigma 54-interacting transcriptional regulator [Lentisphaeria bacterium]|nr:sigma 54-interacting transcriptional regulator [Lentisphaeria bacterium]
MGTSDSFLRAGERPLLQAMSHLAFCNPFLPERVKWEKEVLGKRFQDKGDVWSAHNQTREDIENLAAIQRTAEDLAVALRTRLECGGKGKKEELDWYESLISYMIYYRYQERFYHVIAAAPDDCRVDFFSDFCDDIAYFFGVLPGTRHPSTQANIRLFSCLFQIRRAFHHIFHNIIGPSMAAARLRAAVWQSIFTHDMRRYRRALCERLADVSVLVTGPSGTGKELVARAIGQSRYMPFDPAKKMFTGWKDRFHTLNLTALSTNLIESELFGHRKGAFTGALDDHTGWLEGCGLYGTVFLDEIGEISPTLQVKLLRVLEDRRFYRLGETSPRVFAGKLIAATNRNLEEEIGTGRFRADLYYRLCSDILTTPSLQERVADCPEELDILTRFLARRVAGEEEAEALAGQVLDWVTQNIDTDYAWPGNIRELEQCVRNVMIRGSYRPFRRPVRNRDFAARFEAGELTADEVLAHYCKRVFDKVGTYDGAGKAIGLDRRTVKSRIESLEN